MGGHGALIGWDSLTDLSEPIRGARLPTASEVRGQSASHAHRAMQSDPQGRLTDFTAKSIASHGRARPLTHTASEVRGRVGGRSASHAHRAMQSDPKGRLTDFTAKRIASHSRVRSGCVRGRIRPPTASHLGLSDRSHDFVVKGHGRPSMASHLGLSEPK